jgi:hypothetical protein
VLNCPLLCLLPVNTLTIKFCILIWCISTCIWIDKYIVCISPVLVIYIYGKMRCIPT